MNEAVYRTLTELESRPETREATIEYLADHLRRFLKRRDRVLILFPDQPDAVGGLMKEAVNRCEGIPQFLNQDKRWITILKTAFVTKCDAIIAPPLLLLGLAKLAQHMGTPLFARNVLVAGYPGKDWMVEGIERGLDCKAWAVYDPGMSTLIAGATCSHGGMHIREQRYRVRLLDEAGEDVQPGEKGRLILESPEGIRFDTGDMARMDTSGCPCGSSVPRLLGIDTGIGSDPVMSRLGESFHYWGSVLDCKLGSNGHGLELELIVFPGEKLPKFPNCAKLVVRAWKPESDEPFPMPKW